MQTPISPAPQRVIITHTPPEGEISTEATSSSIATGLSPVAEEPSSGDQVGAFEKSEKAVHYPCT